MDGTGHARITDFGLARVTQNLDSIRSLSDGRHTARWTAPEILSEQGSYSKEADVFSFAMVMIEVHYGWVFGPDFCLPLPLITTGIYWCDSVQEEPACGSYVGDNEWQAPGPTDASGPHRTAVGVGKTMLGSGPSFAPGGFRGIKGFGRFVSPLPRSYIR